MPANLFQGMGDFPIALMIFAGIAIFLILRLRSVLGKRIGFEKPPLPPSQRADFANNAPINNTPIIEGQALPARAGRPVPDPRSPLGERLMLIVNRDRNFDPPEFLAAAEANFRVIVTAFATGDRATLKNLLTPSVYQTFEQAIIARESANLRHTSEIKAIPSATIEDAELVGDLAAIIVRFTSDQVERAFDANGTPQAGTEATTQMVDLWTFERNLKTNDRVWRLAAARSG